MSLMDLFSSKGGTFEPSPGSSRGNLKDWFLNMKGRKPFGRTIRPEDDSERGDWLDWFLNREGLAGEFSGSDWGEYSPSFYDTSYTLFNDGGSVENKTSFYSGGSPGPRTRKKLEPRSNNNYIRSNALDNYYGWDRSMGRDVRYEPQLPPQYQYPLGGRTVVSDVEPDFTDFGARYRAGPPTEGFPMTPEWECPEGYSPVGFQEGIVNSNKGYDIFNDYLNFADSNFDFDFGKQKVSWAPELLGGNFEASIDPEELYLGMKWGI